MIDQIPAVAQLLKQLQHVPYLATKNLYRVAHYFLTADVRKIDQFCTALQALRDCLDTCQMCCCFKEKAQPCSLCSSPKRNQRIICVVETWQDLLAIEKAGGYTGVYHVLNGVLNPLEGIGAEDLTIQRLLARITSDAGIAEIILALNQTPEGEATAAYIAMLLRDGPSLLISCLARGVPVGSYLESMDRLTVYKAVNERRPF